jgi:hypothetical protein
MSGLTQGLNVPVDYRLNHGAELMAVYAAE